MRTASAFAIAWAALPAARALVVTPGSDCETKCGNVLDSTSPDEIVCKQQDYSTTDAGKMFTDCLTCLEHSVYTQDGKQTDTQWMLCTSAFPPLEVSRSQFFADTLTCR